MTDLQLLAMPKEELEDMVHQLDTIMEDMREELRGCDWCCGGGDERMGELGDKRRKLAEILKAKTTTEGESDE